MFQRAAGTSTLWVFFVQPVMGDGDSDDRPWEGLSNSMAFFLSRRPRELLSVCLFMAAYQA